MSVRVSILLITLVASNVLAVTVKPKDFVRHYAELSYTEDVDYLLSYPRSGNTLVRYMFEFITGRPTMELATTHSVLNIFLAHSFSELKVDVRARPLWKVHRNRVIKAQSFYHPGRTRVVLLIRNYKEIAFRYSQFRKLPLFDDDGNLIEENLSRALSIWYLDDERELFFENIAFFDQFPQEKKLLIYYEDLVNNPDKIIHQLCAFFGGSDERRQELVQNYQHYQQRIYDFYNKEEKSLSDTDDILFYSKQYSAEQCRAIDNWVKEHHYAIWQKYLSYYDERNFRDC